MELLNALMVKASDGKGYGWLRTWMAKATDSKGHGWQRPRMAKATNGKGHGWLRSCIAKRKHWPKDNPGLNKAFSINGFILKD